MSGLPVWSTSRSSHVLMVRFVVLINDKQGRINISFPAALAKTVFLQAMNQLLAVILLLLVAMPEWAKRICTKPTNTSRTYTLANISIADVRVVGSDDLSTSRDPASAPWDGSAQHCRVPIVDVNTSRDSASANMTAFPASPPLFPPNAICRQAMVCPNPQRPTDSGNDSEYSAQQTPRRTHEEFKTRCPHLFLRSVDQINPSTYKSTYGRRTDQQSTGQYTGAHARIAGHRSAWREKRGGRARRTF